MTTINRDGADRSYAKEQKPEKRPRGDSGESQNDGRRKDPDRRIQDSWFVVNPAFKPTKDILRVQCSISVS